jgi:predicted acetyltransferase
LSRQRADRDIRPVSEAHLEELIHNGTVAFGPLPVGTEPEFREHLRRALPHTLGSFQDGRLASAATMFPFEAWIGGVRQPLGGLASVATAPWARRGGHVAALLVRWLERLHDRGVAWCAEQPFDPRFYARYGFQSVPNGQAVEIAPELFGADRPPDAQNLTDGDLSALKTLHAAFARRYGFALARDDDARDAWGRLLRPWVGPPRHVYLLQDAYLVFHLADDGGRLHVTDFAYATPEARARLWSLVGAFRGQARQVRIHLPPGEPLLFDTQARHGVRSPLIQVRLVDLAAALTPLRAPRESRWHIELRDEVCPWNDGTFELTLSEAGCSATPSRTPAGTRLHVRALAALLAQAATPEALLVTGQAGGDPEPLRALAELTRGQPTFLAEADGF